MITSWYYAEDGGKQGPVSQNDLQLALNRGEIDRQTLVWCEGMPQWQALENVEDLQPLLEQVPPPLPDQPPPLPPQTPAPSVAAGDAVADRDDRAGRQDDPPETDRRPKKAKAYLAGKLDQIVDWLGDKIGQALWDRLSSQPALALVLAPSIVVGVVVTVNQFRPKEPSVPSATGQVRIDANPWGEIGWIRGPGGGNVDLPAVRTTPFVLTLPAGNYQVEVDYPHAQASQRCDLRVQPDQVSTCWLDLAPVDAKSYFQQIGW